MAVVFTAPGVYVDEIPSGVRTIIGVATSITAFVGRCRRGAIEATDPPLLVSSWAEFVRACGDVWTESELPTAVQQYFLAGGSLALIVRVAHTDDAVSANNVRAAEFDLGGGLRLAASSPGSWANNLRVTVAHPSSIEPVDTNMFHLTVLRDDGTPRLAVVEEHRRLSVDPGSARNVQRVLQTRSALLRASTDTPTRPAVVTAVAPTAGSDGIAPTDTEMSAALERLRLADVVNLLCIPPYARDGSGPALSVYTAALSVCVDLRAMLLIDPPAAWSSVATAADMTGMTGLQSANTIMMYPAVRAADPARDNLEREFAPSPFFAGVTAKTDATRGVWVSPAGIDAQLRGVSDFEQVLTEADIGQINQRGVNALVRRGVAGPVVWGSRTTLGADTRASDWKYVAVRRLALLIEESLLRGLRWAVFEPNDEPLWAEIRGAVSAFMQGLFRDGAFAGSQVRDAYEVKCDKETTTPEDVARGIVNLVVRFAPLRPAEFVVLQFQQMAGQGGA